jgi:ATP-dependent RNA helicase RhlE
LLFNELNIIEPILSALESEGYRTPTPIQEKSIPIALSGRDLLGCAQTGTGKTAAFAIPILQQLYNAKQIGKQYKSIKALILTPTRELAIQIDESFAAYGRNLDIKHLVIYGGVPQNAQITALRKGTDILVATPGRLLDFVEQGFINLAYVKIFVLDEADRMLDMGFIYDVKAVVAKLPEQRQTLFFSATMPNEIAKLADSILQQPLRVEVTPVSSTAKTVVQSMYFVEKSKKIDLLTHILKDSSIERVLVFMRTKHASDEVVRDLLSNDIHAEAIHGNKSQHARQRALSNFKTGDTRVLVATDIAARGIDIENLTHVLNYELPNEPETYVHRIGRTGRAGASGIAFSFCDREEMGLLRDIQKLLGKTVPVVKNHPFQMAIVLQDAQKKSPKKPSQSIPVQMTNKKIVKK